MEINHQFYESACDVQDGWNSCIPIQNNKKSTTNTGYQPLNWNCDSQLGTNDPRNNNTFSEKDGGLPNNCGMRYDDDPGKDKRQSVSSASKTGKSRNREQKEESRKSFAGVISESIQKIFRRSATGPDKTKEVVRETENNLETDECYLDNAYDEADEFSDADDMWSEDEFDQDDDVYINMYLPEETTNQVEGFDEQPQDTPAACEAIPGSRPMYGNGLDDNNSGSLSKGRRMVPVSSPSTTVMQDTSPINTTDAKQNTEMKIPIETRRQAESTGIQKTDRPIIPYEIAASVTTASEGAVTKENKKLYVNNKEKLNDKSAAGRLDSTDLDQPSASYARKNDSVEVILMPNRKCDQIRTGNHENFRTSSENKVEIESKSNAVVNRLRDVVAGSRDKVAKISSAEKENGESKNGRLVNGRVILAKQKQCSSTESNGNFHERQTTSGFSNELQQAFNKTRTKDYVASKKPHTADDVSEASFDSGVGTWDRKPAVPLTRKPDFRNLQLAPSSTNRFPGESAADRSRGEVANVLKMTKLFENNERVKQGSQQHDRSMSPVKRGLVGGQGSKTSGELKKPVIAKKPSPMSVRNFTSSTTQQKFAPPPLPSRELAPKFGGWDASGRTPTPQFSSNSSPVPPSESDGSEFYLMPSDDQGQEEDNEYNYCFEERRFPIIVADRPLPPTPPIPGSAAQPTPPAARNASTVRHGLPPPPSIPEVVNSRKIPSTENQIKSVSAGRVGPVLQNKPAAPPQVPLPKKPANAHLWGDTIGRKSTPPPPPPAFKPKDTLSGDKANTGSTEQNELGEILKARRIQTEKVGQPTPHGPPQGQSSKPKPSVLNRLKPVFEPDEKPKTFSNEWNRKLTITNQMHKTLENQPWYFGDIGRSESENRLKQVAQDGAFLVRCRSEESYPYALTFYKNQTIHNLLIRFRPDNSIALGQEKPGEAVFKDIKEMIAFYLQNSIPMQNGSQVKLTKSPPK